MPDLSDAKIAEIYAEIQLNPEILTENQAFVESRIDSAGQWLVNQIGLTRYPELVSGFSKSRAGVSTDITSLASNEIMISVDGEIWNTLQITLSGANTGALIATELQAQIRAIGVDAYKFVTVVFADTIYTVTSPTFGVLSSVFFEEVDGKEEIAQALGLSTKYGGTEIEGGEDLPVYDDMVVRLVQAWFNEIGVEGMKSYSESGAISLTQHDLDPVVMRFITDNRLLIR